jgi:hypothetical protein
MWYSICFIYVLGEIIIIKSSCCFNQNNWRYYGYWSKTENAKDVAVSCFWPSVPEDVSDIVLPTYESVMKYYLMVKQQRKSTDSTKEPNVSEVSERVALKVEHIWTTASIPIISHTRVLQLLRAYHYKYRKLIKSFKGRQNDSLHNTRRNCSVL